MFKFNVFVARASGIITKFLLSNPTSWSFFHFKVSVANPFCLWHVIEVHLHSFVCVSTVLSLRSDFSTSVKAHFNHNGIKGSDLFP